MSRVFWKPIKTAPNNNSPVVVWRPRAPEKRRIGIDYRSPEEYNGDWARSRPAEMPTLWQWVHAFEPGLSGGDCSAAELAREHKRKVSQSDTLCEQDRKSFQNPRNDAFENETIRTPQVYKSTQEQTDLLDALSAARGYLLNAKIDLETGAPKKTAINTIEGGLRLVGDALKKAGVSV